MLKIESLRLMASSVIFFWDVNKKVAARPVLPVSGRAGASTSSPTGGCWNSTPSCLNARQPSILGCLSVDQHRTICRGQSAARLELDTIPWFLVLNAVPAGWTNPTLLGSSLPRAALLTRQRARPEICFCFANLVCHRRYPSLLLPATAGTWHSQHTAIGVDALCIGQEQRGE